jgi:hypothetical protein
MGSQMENEQENELVRVPMSCLHVLIIAAHAVPMLMCLLTVAKQL